MAKCEDSASLAELPLPPNVQLQLTTRYLYRLYVSTLNIDGISLSLSLSLNHSSLQKYDCILEIGYESRESKVTIMALEMHIARTLSTRNDCETVGKEVTSLQLDHVIGHSSTKPTNVKYICTVRIVIVVF